MLQIVGGEGGREGGGEGGRGKLSFQCLRPFGPQTKIIKKMVNEICYTLKAVITH
jgi:hypothetical protein